MCDPIIDGSEKVETEEFTKTTVTEYLKTRNTFSRFPLRHFSQLEVSFEEETIKILLERLQIPNIETTVSIFGGYTGQFAKCLRNVGMNVIFTDPLEEWVQDARASGFEAYRYSAAQIPKEIIVRTDLFATFECYPALGESSIYTVLRFLATRFGILFVESERTKTEIEKEEERKLAQLKNSFLQYSKVYSAERLFKERADLRFYHFFSSEDKRRTIRQDCRIMKLIYDSFPNQSCLTKQNLSSLAERMGASHEEILESLERMLRLYQFHIPVSLQPYIPSNWLRICSKQFTVEEGLFA